MQHKATLLSLYYFTDIETLYKNDYYYFCRFLNINANCECICVSLCISISISPSSVDLQNYSFI